MKMRKLKKYQKKGEIFSGMLYDKRKFFIFQKKIRIKTVVTRHFGESKTGIEWKKEKTYGKSWNRNGQ